jgi:hypothetical protein
MEIAWIQEPLSDGDNPMSLIEKVVAAPLESDG